MASSPEGALAASPWPRRVAWLTLASAVVLFVLGGSVTTFRVGMAVPDWPQTFGHNMFLYPLSDMLQNFGVTLEHSHRLLGAWVGLCAIALVGVTWTLDRRASARWLSVLALAAICFQGWLGGARVLENSEDLAFLHGSFAQAVFALLGAACILQSPRWRAQRGAPCKEAPGLHRATLLLVPAVYAQVVLGAWLRHSGRPLPLALHVLVALAVVAAAFVVARRLSRAAAAGGDERAVLVRERRRLVGLVLAQFALGAGALLGVAVVSGGFDQPVSRTEAVLATAHVVLGALLLVQAVAVAMWSRRVLTDPRARLVEVTP